jgi:hypothetical protein
MQRFTSILIILVSLVFLSAAPAAGWFFGGGNLVSIDGQNYTGDDFKRWWKFYNDDKSSLPKTPDPYIDWLLLAREAERMEMSEDPGFQRNTRIFLQSRTLLMLKHEEVTSKIEVTDDDVKARYEEKFLPLWLVQYLTFKDEEAASAAWRDLSAGQLTVDELLARDAEQGGPVAKGSSWLRPVGIDPEWTEIFSKLKVGEVADPSEYKNKAELYYLKEQRDSDEEDLARMSKEIRSDLWKERENRLTLRLLFELKEKYQVVVDEERLAAIDINADPDTFSDEPLITSSKQNVSEKEFMAVIRRLMSNRTAMAHAGGKEEETEKLKRETAGNIIGQNVTNWESIDRQYENKEPFKWEYQFNYNHRLGMMLQNRLFASKATATEEEIEQYYRENIDRYTQPAMVKMYVIDETQGPIDQIWADASSGGDFRKAMKQHLGSEPKPVEAPANHLDPEVREVVDRLAAGETSNIFKAQGDRVVVHLTEKISETSLSLDLVKEKIRSTIVKEKRDQMLSAYLDQIKSRTEIKIRKRQWQAIQRELGGTR